LLAQGMRWVCIGVLHAMKSYNNIENGFAYCFLLFYFFKLTHLGIWKNGNTRFT
ncbi:hypothetical protein T10_9786, partial [Trichinella papuae]